MLFRRINLNIKMENVEIKKCRVCESDNLIPIISLGNQHIVNFVDSKHQESPKCPLDLVLCEKCKLVQLKHNAPSEAMWGDQYWYKSSINKMIREDLKDIVQNVENIYPLNSEDIVVDIGCNDGTLLDFYSKDKALNLVGFEPSSNVARESSEKGFEVINDFFNSKSFKEKFGNKKAKVITAISMFYDLEDPNKFMEDIVECLDEKGLFVIQQNYIVKMLENNAFDNICHEHREYYSYLSLKNLLDKYNLETFDIVENEINGGSIRTYIKFKGNQNLKGAPGSEERIAKLIEKEKEIGLDTIKPYIEFASRIENIKKELIEFLKEKKQEGKSICALGASTRGLVLLQYFGLGPEIIDCIFDRNPDKEGKKSVGSWIPITSPDNFEKYKPDYQLVLIWHIFKGIGDDEKEFVNKGGKFILPLPSLNITNQVD